MEFELINQAMSTALEQLRDRDRHLLIHGLHERSISHRLAVYLETLLPNFNVDCEYNGNVDADNGKKYIYFLKANAPRLKIKLKDEEIDADTIERSIYPDIIVHRRGGNGPENNLLVAEIKLTSSTVDVGWDKEKLSRFTSSEFENRFDYQYGVFILLGVKEQFGLVEVEWYRDGGRFL